MGTMEKLEGGINKETDIFTANIKITSITSEGNSSYLLELIHHTRDQSTTPK